MTSADIKRLGLILAVRTEIEGMKAENLQHPLSQPYGEYDFKLKADKIVEIVNKHDDQL